MKKVIFLLSLLVIGMFLIGCGTTIETTENAGKLSEVSESEYQKCEQITKKIDQLSCYFNLAETTKNVDVCSKIDPLIQDSCVNKVALASSNEELCNQITESDVKNNCLATIKKDSSFCDLIDSELTKNNCLLAIAEVNLDESICDKITSKFTNEKCLLTLAKAKSDVSICEKLPVSIEEASAVTQNNCYREMAELLEDEIICNKLDDSFSISTCFVSLAEIKKDPELCNNIVPAVGIDVELLKSSCVEGATSETG
jgi:hypothetical protein